MHFGQKWPKIAGIVVMPCPCYSLHFSQGTSPHPVCYTDLQAEEQTAHMQPMIQEETSEPMWYSIVTIAVALPSSIVNVLLLVDRYRKRRTQDAGK